MAYDETIKAGTTSKIIEVTMRDSTTGGGKTGIAFGDVSAYYVLEGGTSTLILLAAGIAGDAYSSGKWAEVDAINMKGLYQFHVPNAALPTGVASVTISLQVAGTIDKAVRIALPAMDVYDAVRAGLSALPGAAADAAGGLPISDTGGLDMDALPDHLTDIKGTGFVKDTDSLVNLSSTVEVETSVDITETSVCDE